VSELVQNSLDANATRIDIGLHCKEWMCWVRDDGHGINKAGLESFGQGEEGGRYSKSLCNTEAERSSYTWKTRPRHMTSGPQVLPQRSASGEKVGSLSLDFFPLTIIKLVQPLPLPQTSPAWKYVPGLKNHEIHGP
jgi:hypothetical protein